MDIIIPTMKSASELASMVEEIQITAGLPVQVIVTDQQASASVNRNYGLDHTTSDPVLMVDDDCEKFPQGWAAKLIAVLEEHPKCVMVSPQLAAPNGQPGCMMGGCQIRRDGVTEARERKLPTACVAVRRNALRFDIDLIGSGFDDDCYCASLRMMLPDALFLVCHDVWIVHRNETKNQHGHFWEHNRAVYEKKWGKR